LNLHHTIEEAHLHLEKEKQKKNHPRRNFPKHIKYVLKNAHEVQKVCSRKFSRSGNLEVTLKKIVFLKAVGVQVQIGGCRKQFPQLWCTQVQEVANKNMLRALNTIARA